MRIKLYVESFIFLFFSLGGLLIDYILSYLAYLNDPNFFITHESNAAAISFFTEGVLPFEAILNQLIVIIVAFGFIPVVKEYIKSCQKTGIKYLFLSFLWVLIFTAFLRFVMHVFGGLTWTFYTKTWNDYFMLSAGAYDSLIIFTRVFTVIIFVVFILDHFVLSKEKKLSIQGVD